MSGKPETENNGKIVKPGHWGKVNLVEGNTASTQDTAYKITRGWQLGWLRNLLGHNNASMEVVNGSILANHVVVKGYIGEDDVQSLANSSQKAQEYHLAMMMSAISMEYEDKAKEIQAESGKAYHYDRGLIIADFLQVIPAPLDARLLMVTADPEISQRNHEGSLNSSTEGIDTLEMSVEGLVLMPNEARHDVFRQLAMMDPGPRGRANRLLSLIGADWYQNKIHARYSGYAAIEANLKGIETPEQVQQFAISSFADITSCRRIIEEVAASSPDKRN